MSHELMFIPQSASLDLRLADEKDFKLTLMKKRHILFTLFAIGLFLSGCSETLDNQAASSPGGMLTFEVEGAGDKLLVFEIAEPQDDSFERWQAYNEQRLTQDKWEAFVDNVKHELIVDLDVPDDFIECEESIDVSVDIENDGDETESVRVLLIQDALHVQSEKFVEVEQGHTRRVEFPVGVDAAPGDYVFEAQVFRNIRFDRNSNVRDGGEFEGRDAERIHIVECRTP